MTHSLIVLKLLLKIEEEIKTFSILDIYLQILQSIF